MLDRPTHAYHAGAIARADLVLVSVNEGVQRGAVDQAFFDEERLEGFDAESEVRRDGLVLVVVGMRMGELGSQGSSCGGHRSGQEIAPVSGNPPLLSSRLRTGVKS